MESFWFEIKPCSSNDFLKRHRETCETVCSMSITHWFMFCPAPCSPCAPGTAGHTFILQLHAGLAYLLRFVLVGSSPSLVLVYQPDFRSCKTHVCVHVF